MHVYKPYIYIYKYTQINTIVCMYKYNNNNNDNNNNNGCEAKTQGPGQVGEVPGLAHLRRLLWRGLRRFKGFFLGILGVLGGFRGF